MQTFDSVEGNKTTGIETSDNESSSSDDESDLYQENRYPSAMLRICRIYSVKSLQFLIGPVTFKSL